jgi:hypothetical protein
VAVFVTSCVSAFANKTLTETHINKEIRKHVRRFKAFFTLPDSSFRQKKYAAVEYFHGSNAQSS